MTKRIKAFFRKKGADKPIFFAVFVLICLGIVMIGSASIGAVSSKGTAFAIKNMITQSIYVAIGVFIMMVLTKGFKLKMINYRSSMAVYIMGIISMCGCVFWTTKGSHAWIHLGPFTVQPAEFMKIGMVLILSYMLTETDSAFVVKGKFRTAELKSKFYKDKLIYQDAKPNNAHKALAKLEEIGKLKAVVTQNIDGLHQMAGSKTVYELHGSVHRNYCTKCHKFFDLDSMLALDGNIPHCDKCGGVVKPDVVLYEEGLDNATIEGAIRAISSADLLIIGGTSLVVYPAASFINYYRGKDMVLINKSSTGYDNEASLVINDAIGEVLKEAVLDVYK